MKRFLAFVTGLMAFNTFAAETLQIPTPRGTQVSVTMHIPQGTNLPALIAAPGQRCNSKGPLFETLGSKGLEKNYAIFRFEWSYCGTSSPKPSAGLKNEMEDMTTVLEFATKHASVDPSKIILVGKSMGSGVAYRIFTQRPDVKAIVLMTPICSETTDANNNPLPAPLSVCDKNYPHLKEDSRPILMTMGNLDENCVLPVLFDFLKDSKGNVQTFVAGGGHGFEIYDGDGNVNSAKTQNNINAVVEVVLNWMDLLL